MIQERKTYDVSCDGDGCGVVLTLTEAYPRVPLHDMLTSMGWRWGAGRVQCPAHASEEPAA